MAKKRTGERSTWSSSPRAGPLQCFGDKRSGGRSAAIPRTLLLNLPFHPHHKPASTHPQTSQPPVLFSPRFHLIHASTDRPLPHRPHSVLSPISPTHLTHPPSTDRPPSTPQLAHRPSLLTRITTPTVHRLSSQTVLAPARSPADFVAKLIAQMTIKLIHR